MSTPDDTLASPVMPDDPLSGTAYRSIGVLGRGGMGEVLEAEHLPLGRRVVVKLLHEALAAEPTFADRLRVEARSLALLQHPNVVAVSDFGRTPGGRPFLVMERLIGRTLGAELRERGVLPPGEAIAIVLQVLAGLEIAHEHGIIHRDVKLENIFLCDAERQVTRTVKVLDFGVAKILAGGAGHRAMNAVATKDGSVVGTPRYLTPEQVRRMAVDARTDVYAVGLVLYTLIAGRGPFAHHTDAIALLGAHLHEIPGPPSRYSPQPIPRRLETAIIKALAKRPDDRFQSAALFAEELGRITGELSARPRVQSRGAEARVLALITLASALVFSAVFMLVWRLWEARR